MATSFSPLNWVQLKKGSDRVEAFLDKFDGKEKFVLVNGTEVEITKIKYKNIDYKPGSVVLRESWMSIPTTLGKVTFFGKDNKQYTWTKLAKTSEFGGQSKSQKGKVNTGGVITEVLSETGFVFYYALLVNGHLDNYSVESWQNVNNTPTFKILCMQFNGVSKMLKYQFNDVKAMDSYLGRMYGFLTDEGWDTVLRAQVKAFKKQYNNIDNSYFLSRPSALPAEINPYTAYGNLANALKGYMGLSTKIGPDKWNPADFWIINEAGFKLMRMWLEKSKKLKTINSETYSSSYMNLVNRQLIKLYHKKNVYPVSLKKSGLKPRIIEVNSAKSEITQTVEYEKVLLAPTNQDVQIFYKLTTFDNGKRIASKNLQAKMKTASGGFRLELLEVGKQGKARYGTIGVGIQQYIIQNTDDSGIMKLEEVRNGVKTENPELEHIIPTTSPRNWMGVNKYSKLGRDAQKLLPYVNRMMVEINGKDSRFLPEKIRKAKPQESIPTKAGAGELAIAIVKIINKHARDITIENLHLAAGSGGVQVGMSPQQLRARMNFFNLDEDDMILLSGNMKEYDALLSA